MFLCSYNKRNEAAVLNNIADIYCCVTRLHSNVIRNESKCEANIKWAMCYKLLRGMTAMLLWRYRSINICY